MKWGKLNGRFHVSLQAEYNDNINLSDTDPLADFLIGPHITTGFVYRLSEKQRLQFNIGGGYTWYLRSPDSSAVFIDPNSRLDYKITVLKRIELSFYDNFSIQTDPTDRPEISGALGRATNFRRINNTVGVMGSLQANRKLSLSAGYDYSLNFSLTDEFTSIDRNEHRFFGGAYLNVGPKMTLGVQGSRTYTSFDQRIQNDGISTSIGPTVTWQVTRVIALSGTAGYTTSTFDQTGVIADGSEFSGVTYELATRHRLNSRMSQEVSWRRTVDLGLGSNFTDSQALQYGVQALVHPALNLNFLLGYEDFSSSGNLEHGQRYLAYIGNSFRISQKMTAGLSYAFAWKDSDQRDRDYLQNRVTLTLTRRF